MISAYYRYHHTQTLTLLPEFGHQPNEGRARQYASGTCERAGQSARRGEIARGGVTPSWLSDEDRFPFVREAKRFLQMGPSQPRAFIVFVAAVAAQARRVHIIGLIGIATCALCQARAKGEPRPS